MMMKKYWGKFLQHKNSAIMLLMLIAMVGAGLRAYNLNSNSFVADEFLDMNSAYGYFKTHVWQAWDFNTGTVTTDVFAPRDERAWLYKWQVAELFRFFPPTEPVARSISVLWGIVTIFLMYHVARYFTRKKSIGLLSAFLFAMSITAIAFDRKLRMYSMFYPLYLLLSLFLYQFFEEDYKGKIGIVKFFYQKLQVNIIYLIPLIIIGLASLSIQLLTVNVVAAFLGYTFIQTIIAARKKSFLNKYSVVTGLAIIMAIGALVIAPQTVTYYSGVLKFFINNQGYFLKILQDYSNYLLATMLLVSGIFFFLRKKLTKEVLWLSTSLFIPLLMAAFLWKRAQGIQYVFFLQSFLIILISSGIYFWADFFRANLSRLKQQSFLTTIFLLLLFLPNYGYFFSSDTTYHRDINEVADYRKVFLYVKKYLQPGDAIITRNFRNYYLSGLKIPVLDFGGERAQGDLSSETIQTFVAQNPNGWVVLFDNDDQFLSKSALSFIEKNMQLVDTSAIRGTAKAYRWNAVQK